MPPKKTKKPTPPPSKFLPLAEAIADDLFTCAVTTNVVIDRLVLTDAKGKDWGGWCRAAVVRQIIAHCEEHETKP